MSIEHINICGCEEISSVYDLECNSINELLYCVLRKIRECVDLSNTSLDFLKWLKEQGLPIELEKIIHEMYLDGSLSELINVQIFNDLNNKIDALYDFYVTPMEYGAIGDGKADDTEALQKCFDNEKFIIIDRKYKFTRKLLLSDSHILGVGDNGLLMDGTWNDNTDLDSRAITNRNFGEVFNKPNTIKIDGVNFLFYNKEVDKGGLPYYFLSFGNTFNSTVENCKFLAPYKTYTHVAFFDGYGSNRNLNFNNNYIEMLTNSQYGGIWFRQIGATDYSENIFFRGNTLIYTTGDEFFGVYSYQGGVKNVIVENNFFKSVGEKTIMNAVSIAGNDETVEGGNKNAYLENITFNNNMVDVHNALGKVIQISMESPSKYINNITCDNNTVIVRDGSTDTRIFSVYDGTNINITNNYIKNVSNINMVAFDSRVKNVLFDGNNIEGIYSNCIRNLGIITNNTIKVSCTESIFFENELVKNNKVYPQNECRICQNVNELIPAMFIDNYVETNFNNVIQTLSLNGDNVIKGNIIKYLNNENKGWLLYVGMWFSENTILKDNICFGIDNSRIVSQEGSIQISGNITFLNSAKEVHK